MLGSFVWSFTSVHGSILPNTVVKMIKVGIEYWNHSMIKLSLIPVAKHAKTMFWKDLLSVACAITPAITNTMKAFFHRHFFYSATIFWLYWQTAEMFACTKKHTDKHNMYKQLINVPQQTQLMLAACFGGSYYLCFLLSQVTWQKHCPKNICLNFVTMENFHIENSDSAFKASSSNWYKCTQFTQLKQHVVQTAL